MSSDSGNKKKRLPASERRKIILDAAQRTFVEFGYHGALMETIAERADVTKPILYRHFPSKLDLLLAILDRAGEELRASLLQPDPKEMDWLTATRHSVDAYFSFIMQSESAFRLIYATNINVDERTNDRIIQIRNSIIDSVTTLISSYTDMTSIQSRDIYILSVMLVGMVETTVRHWMNNREISHEVYEKSLVNAAASILAGLPPRFN
jgi:AcrR family transcriptional regulator